MIRKLKEAVLSANMELYNKGLILHTWGNASAYDRELGLVAIKPSGVPYESIKLDDIVVVKPDGTKLEGKNKPSTDLPTHLVLYQHFPNINGVVHTHSLWATIWAQAEKSIPVYGTTHADHFLGDIPCTRRLRQDEINSLYEKETGKVIVETFQNMSEDEINGVLVSNHGPFTWGRTVDDAVSNASVLEAIAHMAFQTLLLNPGMPRINISLLQKHYQRKNGLDAYYGQREDVIKYA